MSEFGGIMLECRPELWRFKQYNITENLSAVRMLFHDFDESGEKIVDQNDEYLVCHLDLPGKTLFLDFAENDEGTVVMTVLEEVNDPLRPNTLIVVEFGAKLPVGQFAYVGSIKGKDRPRYVFAVSGFRRVVSND